MIECPHCGLGKSMVIDSRPHKKDMALRRRRQCLKCDARFSTNEITVSRYKELNELLEASKIIYTISRGNR